LPRTSLKPSQQPQLAERRTSERQRLILRAGVLEQEGRTSFCLVKNVSFSGIQVKLYSSTFVPGEVLIRVADEDAIKGKMVWIEGDHAGIRFDDDLDHDAILRLTQKLVARRRRSIPRVKAAARALIRMAGRDIPAELCDISSFGAKIRTKRELPADHPAIVELPDLPSIRAYVRWSDGCESGLLFATPIPMQVIGQWVDERLRVSP
jgi:hypothetical protein